jgi:hypothetical protein
MSSPYGRPFRRRKAAAFWGKTLCSICGRPILRSEDGTLHHVVPVADGGTAPHERPAHKNCNARHGGKLGAERRRKKRRSGTGQRPRCWPGAIDYEAEGHEIIRLTPAVRIIPDR